MSAAAPRFVAHRRSRGAERVRAGVGDADADSETTRGARRPVSALSFGRGVVLLARRRALWRCRGKRAHQLAGPSPARRAMPRRAGPPTAKRAVPPIWAASVRGVRAVPAAHNGPIQRAMVVGRVAPAPARCAARAGCCSLTGQALVTTPRRSRSPYLRPCSLRLVVWAGNFSIGASASQASLCTNMWMTCANARRICVQRGDNVGIPGRPCLVAGPLPGRILSTPCAREKP